MTDTSPAQQVAARESDTNTYDKVINRFLQAVIDGDPDGFLSAWAPDAHIEFPFAPEGMPRHLRGHDEIREFFSGVRADAGDMEAKLYRTEPFADPSMLWVEYGEEFYFEGKNVSGRYLALATFRDGLISHWKEFFDPTVMAGVADFVPERFK